MCDCISMPLLACEASLLAFITLISSWPLSLTRYLNVWSLVCWGAWVSACVLEYPGILRNMVGEPDGSGQEVEVGAEGNNRRQTPNDANSAAVQFFFLRAWQHYNTRIVKAILAIPAGHRAFHAIPSITHTHTAPEVSSRHL